MKSRRLGWLLMLLLSACGGDTDVSGDPPRPLSPVTIEDPYFSYQWNLNADAVSMFDIAISSEAHIHGSEELARYSGQGVRIAVIDDGLDIAHEDLQGAVVATYNLRGDSNVLDPLGRSPSHGTAVTGIIAARHNLLGIRGVAPQAEVIFIEYDQQMSDSDMLRAFAKAEAAGADIINCSWGTYDVSPSVKEAIQKLAREGRGGKGIPIVYAVGNGDRSMANDESAIPEVIAVGASNENNERARYSNYGPELDLLAPGGEWLGIATIDPMGVNGVAASWPDPAYLLPDDIWAFGGTSAAAPTVTGVIALMLEINPQLTNEEIIELLRRTADPIGFMTYYDGRNDYYGFGKVNLGAAVRAIYQQE